VPTPSPRTCGPQALRVAPNLASPSHLAQFHKPVLNHALHGVAGVQRRHVDQLRDPVDVQAGCERPSRFVSVKLRALDIVNQRQHVGKRCRDMDKALRPGGARIWRYHDARQPPGRPPSGRVWSSTTSARRLSLNMPIATGSLITQVGSAPVAYA
jgi:hypothetical protein